jgi:hypothetical protein
MRSSAGSSRRDALAHPAGQQRRQFAVGAGDSFSAWWSSSRNIGVKASRTSPKSMVQPRIASSGALRCRRSV